MENPDKWAYQDVLQDQQSRNSPAKDRRFSKGMSHEIQVNTWKKNGKKMEKKHEIFPNLAIIV